jgi:hypothetical protein
MVEQHHQIGDVMLFKQFNDMQHDRPVKKRNHRFWHAAGEGLDAGAEAAGHDDCFHECVLLFLHTSCVALGLL